METEKDRGDWRELAWRFKFIRGVGGWAVEAEPERVGVAHQRGPWHGLPLFNGCLDSLALIRTKHGGRYLETSRSSSRAWRRHRRKRGRGAGRLDQSRRIRRDNPIVLFIYIVADVNIDRVHRGGEWSSG